MNDLNQAQVLRRHVQIDNWVFEVKSIKAIKVDNYGSPYSAVASFTITGDNAYIDGLLTNDGEEFTKSDYQTFIKMSQQLNLSQVNFDRFKRNRRVCNTVKIPPIATTEPTLTLVSAS